jgi:hypothetical protein
MQDASIEWLMTGKYHDQTDGTRTIKVNRE